jgi:FkbM family methyltransferase
MQIYREIFRKDIYRLRRMKDSGFSPRVVWDIGGNIGLFSHAVRLLWPDAEIHAWEPHSDLFEYYQTNAPTATLHKSAAWSAPGKSEIVSSMKHGSAAGSYISCLPDDQGFDRLPESANTTVCDLEVPWDTAPAPDLIKLDCEGAEYELLQHLPCRPQYMAVEFHGINGANGMEEGNRLQPDYDWQYSERGKTSTVIGKLK